MVRRPKYNPKPDGNQTKIKDELKALGYDVDIIAALPGLYDLVVSGRRFEVIKAPYSVHEETRVKIAYACSVRVEVKSEDGELNETEKRYCERQKHIGAYIVARSTEDVLKWFGAI